MMNLWITPTLSIHLHTTVPFFTLYTFVPPNPFIGLFYLIIGPSKSSIRWDIHAEHLLSMPTFAESVSNCSLLVYLLLISACMATTGDETIFPRFFMYLLDIFAPWCFANLIPIYPYMYVLPSPSFPTILSPFCIPYFVVSSVRRMVHLIVLSLER